MSRSDCPPGLGNRVVTLRRMTISESRRPRGRMAAAYVLVVVGTALLTIAILIPTYMVPRVKKIPLDISAATVSEATGSVLDADELKRTGRLVTATNVPLRAYVYVTAENPADADVVTMQANTLLERTDRTDESKLVRASIDRVTIDRVTAEPQTEPTPTIQSEANGLAEAVPREGYQYKLPFDTQKVSTYPYFDTIARMTTPLDYVDDDRVIDGLRLYHFRQSIGPLNLAETQDDEFLTVPAAALGLPGDEQIRMDLHYKVEREMWVEPKSGSIVAQEEHITRFLARSAYDPAAVITLDMTTHFDQPTQQRTAALAKDARAKIMWGSVYAPIGAAVLGILSLAGAAWLGVRDRRRSKRQQPDSAALVDVS